MLPVRFRPAATCAVVLGTTFTLSLAGTRERSKGHGAPASPAGQNWARSKPCAAGFQGCPPAGVLFLEPHTYAATRRRSRGLCQTREKKPMIAADLFANRCGVQKQKENPEAPVNPGDSVAAHNRFPAAYGPLARRSSGWLITGWPRFDSWMGHQTRHQPGRYRAVAPEVRHHHKVDPEKLRFLFLRLWEEFLK